MDSNDLRLLAKLGIVAFTVGGLVLFGFSVAGLAVRIFGLLAGG